jgi:hypothetical protein
MDGNNAKKAPVLDYLVATTNSPTNKKAVPTTPPQATQPRPGLATMNNNGASARPAANPIRNTTMQTENMPQNRRTDKSEFEIELTKTVNKIMLQHLEHASEKIVQQVLSQVRARLPGRKKS